MKRKEPTQSPSSALKRGSLSLLIFISTHHFINYYLPLPTAEAFTSSSSLRKTHSHQIRVLNNNNNSNNSNKKPQPQQQIQQQKKQPIMSFLQHQYYDYNDKEKQSHLFQIVGKYKRIQEQLSSLDLLQSYKKSSSSTTSSSSSSSFRPRSLLEQDDDDDETLLEKQAKALQISKSTLSFLQLKGQKAREEILLSNMGLVHSTVNKFIYKLNRNNNNNNNNNNSSNSSNSNFNRKQQYNLLNNINKEDLIQEGMIGLTKAIDKYDPTKKASFSTYAMYWIEGYIIRYMKTKSSFVHIPEYMQSIVKKLERKVYELDFIIDGTGASAAASSSCSGSSGGSGDDKFTNLENIILQDEDKMNLLCRELGHDIKTIKMAFKVRRTIHNTKVNSMIELQDWMMKRGGGGDGSYDVDVMEMIASSSSSTSSTSSSMNGMGGMSGIVSSSVNGKEVWNENINNTDGDEVLQRYQNILGQFISMREMEALSWRYGLLKQQQQEDELEEGLEQHVRDYEAEAEQDLFGPGGILSLNSSSSSSRRISSSNISSSSSRESSSIPQTVRVTSQSVKVTTAATTTTSLSKKNKTTMVLNKGGRWGEAMSFNEVGEQMRVSAEYGRRLCASALKKLTKAVEDGQLDPAMLF